MSEPKKYWMTDAEGAKALVAGAEARDFWTVHGWSEADEPTGEDFVWLQNEETSGRGKFTAAAVPLWEPRGWRPSDPPAPVNLAVGVVIEPPVPAGPPEPKPTAPKSAASATSGDKKE